MSVGGQASTATINGSLTNLSTGIRNLMQGVTNLNTFVNGGGNGVNVLAELGFSTIPTASNPGGVSDAQLALNIIGYLNTVSGVYYGTVQQGGTGGTGATMFNFNNALSLVWAGS